MGQAELVGLYYKGNGKKKMTGKRKVYGWFLNINKVISILNGCLSHQGDMTMLNQLLMLLCFSVVEQYPRQRIRREPLRRRTCPRRRTTGAPLRPTLTTTTRWPHMPRPPRTTSRRPSSGSPTDGRRAPSSADWTACRLTVQQSDSLTLQSVVLP